MTQEVVLWLKHSSFVVAKQDREKFSFALEERLALLALRRVVRLPQSHKASSSAQNIVLRALLGNSHGAPRRPDGIGLSL